MKMTFQNIGTVAVIHLYGTKAELNETHTKFYNWGATGGELVWHSEGAAMFWTTPGKMLKALTNINLMRLLGGASGDASKYKGKKGGVMEEARALAKAEFEAIPKEENPIRFGAHNIFEFEMGAIAAERPDSDFKDSVLSYAFAGRE